MLNYIKSCLRSLMTLRVLKTIFLGATGFVLMIGTVVLLGHPRQRMQQVSFLPFNFRGKWQNGGMFMENIDKSRSPALRDDLTLVTAFFDLGPFRKGHLQTYTPELYRKWMSIFGIIQNPLVIFVDNEKDYEYFTKLRASFPSNSTIIQKISRADLWAFRLQPRIQNIYDSFFYPKHHPNTVLASYSCAMHAKYELVQEVAWENIFRTRYIAWLDVGCFRDLNTTREKSLSLYIPPGLSKEKVAYTEVYARDSEKSSREIFHENHVWVAGGFYIGHVDVVLAWTREYMSFVERFIDESLMNTDQQILYAMANLGREGKYIQTYKGNGRYNKWLHLPYICKEQGSTRNKNQ